jgi:hypothetical protein
MNKIITLLLLLISFSVFSQSIGIGEWRDELPYGQAISIGVSDDIVYGVTPYSLFTLRKSDNTMNRYSKINGLSDFGVSTLEYDSKNDVVFVAYSNTNIDLIKNGVIINIPDIKRKQILGKKSINNIYFIDDIAYLSCGFGIVLVDVVREEIKDTWYIGDDGNSLEVFDISHIGDDIYAATEVGLRKANLNDSNLADFQSWEVVQEIPHADGRFDQVETHQGKIVVNYHPESFMDSLFVLENNTWSRVFLNEAGRITNIIKGDSNFYVTRNYSMDLYYPDLSFKRKVYKYDFAEGIGPIDVVEDGPNVYWVADKVNGLVKTSNFYQFQYYLLNGPRTASVFDMATSGNRLVVAAGGRNDSYANLYKKDGVFTKVDQTWTNYHLSNTGALDTIFDLVCVSVNPTNPNQYALGSWGRGVTVFNENGLEAVYSTKNSSLTPVNGFPQYLRIGGLAYDQSGNLWVNSASSNALIHKMDPSGNWTAFELGSSSSADVGKMTIDSRGYKWIQMRQGGSNFVFVFDETQVSGQQLQGLNGYPNNGNIPGNTVTAIADDLDGEIWLGTDAGIGVIYNPRAIFNGGDFDAQRIIVERDGYAQYLLEAEKVQAIAIDGANQKWIGTQRGGVFLLSPDGQEEIYHFTSENSPLYSDNIIAIQVHENGEVFIGTDRGIIVFKGEATPPEKKLENVYAYPNPVRPEYSGAIAIKGLVRDANVKITDAFGGLVHESRAYGGQAIWDGNNMNGNRVQSGVYMVFISDDTGEETKVTKILFVR